jgi:hypothetical protein
VQISGVKSAPHSVADAVPVGTTNLHSGASCAAPRGASRWSLRAGAELNGILACFPEGGDELNHLRRGLLRSNAEISRVARLPARLGLSLCLLPGHARAKCKRDGQLQCLVRDV